MPDSTAHPDQQAQLQDTFSKLVHGVWANRENTSSLAFYDQENELLTDLVTKLDLLFPDRFSHEYLTDKIIWAVSDLLEQRQRKPTSPALHKAFQTLLKELSHLRQEWTVIVPIENLELAVHDLTVGKVTFRPHDETGQLATQLRENGLLHLDDFRFVQAYAEVVEAAEGRKAVHKAVEDVEMALNALRVWSSPLRTTGGTRLAPAVPSIMGDIPYRRRAIYGLRKGSGEANPGGIDVAATGETVGRIAPLLLTQSLLDSWRPLGFHRLSQILADGTPSKMGRRVLNALRWMGEARKTPNLEDAFVKNSIALETLLLGDGAHLSDPTTSIGSITAQLAEQTAFLLGRTGDERRRIAKDITRLYRIRSSIVHYGVSVQEGELTVWELYIIHSLAALLTFDFGHIQALRDWTNHIKFSGEPPEEPRHHRPLWHSLYGDEHPRIWPSDQPPPTH